MEKTLVSKIMSKDPFTTTADSSLEDVLNIMMSNHIRRVPVVNEKGQVIGIISDRDLRLAIDSPFLKITTKEKLEHLAKHTAREIMRTTIHTIEEDASIVDAAKLMRFSGVGSLPVLEEEGRLIGIVTRSDFIDQLIRVLDPIKGAN